MSATIAPARGLSFGGVLRSEWIKLRSLRSTVWCFAIIIAITIGLGFLLAATFNSEQPLPLDAQQSIWVQVATLGIGFSQLVAAVLGALVITGEYGTGMIRSTFAAVPERITAILAKAIVVSVTTFVVALVSVFATALLTAPLLPGNGINPDFGDSKVWLALLGGAAYIALISLLSFSIGAIIRNSAGGIAASLGLVLVLPTVVQIIAGITRADWARNLGEFLPSAAGSRMYGYVTGETPAAPDVIVLTSGAGALVLVAWVVVLFVIAAVLTKRRDA